VVSDFLQGFLKLVRGSAEQPWDQQERRGQVRMECQYRCVFDLEGTRFPASVSDLGEGGLRLTVSEPVAVGKKLRVFCPFVDVQGPSGPIEGVVCWTRPSEARGLFGLGLRYTSEPQQLRDSWVTWVLQLLGFPGHTAHRTAGAESVLAGSIREHRVEIHDLGIGGASIKSGQSLEAGPVTLCIDGWNELPPLQLNGTLVHEGARLRFELGDTDDVQLQALGDYLKALLQKN
jgi:hypothetical protein